MKEEDRISSYNLKVHNAHAQAKSILHTLLIKEECKGEEPAESILIADDETEHEVGLVRR
jgi:hypothetical protein